jgi:large subunit ribosomal protein L25
VAKKETAVLKISKRQKLGTLDARRLRAKGMIPAIVYGHGEPNEAVALGLQEIDAAVRHGAHLVKGDLDGVAKNYLIKDIQFDYMGRYLIHVDLTRVNLDERVQVSVPIVLRGIPVGVETEGGVLTQYIARATIDVLVTEIPDDIRVPVNDMHVDDVLKLGALPLPAGVKIVGDPEMRVAVVDIVAEEVAAVAEVAAVGEPEVIGAKKEEEGEEGAAPAAGEKAEKPEKKEKKE